jgi:hypothetical protein
MGGGPGWGALLSGTAAERMLSHLPPPTPTLPHKGGGRQKRPRTNKLHLTQRYWCLIMGVGEEAAAFATSSVHGALRSSPKIAGSAKP